MDVEYNKPIESIEFDHINLISKISLQSKVRSVIQARTDKKVYRVECKNNNLYRFDFGRRYLVNIIEQNIASQYVNIPKIICIVPEKRCKISQWIDGSILSTVANDPEVLIKSGELMAKLNLIENDVHACLSNCEFSDSNAIWTGEQVWLIDLGRLRWTLDTASTISQVLIKRMRCMSRINLFLEGYVKYNPNNYERIISHCKSIDWTWVNKKTIMNEQLKCHV